MVSPTRTTTAPLACLARRPVSMVSRLSPIVRSTMTGFRVAKDEVDMDYTTTYVRSVAVGEWEGGRASGPLDGTEARSLVSDGMPRVIRERKRPRPSETPDG